MKVAMEVSGSKAARLGHPRLLIVKCSNTLCPLVAEKL